jgi:hypothetical protein
MKISGLDTKSCAGKKIKIQVFNSETTTAMSLYEDSGNLAVDRALLEIDADKTISREEAVSLINGYGQNIGYFSSFQYIDFDANRAEYLVVFTNPLAVMSDVTRVGLESTNA